MSIPRYWPKLRLRPLGFRGTFLLMFGLIYVFIGLAVLTNPGVNPVLFHTQFPVWFRILIWSGAGGSAVVAAFTHRRWVRAEYIGYGALVFGPTERMLSYTAAMFRAPDLMWLAAALIYLLLAGVVILVAGWPEPLEIPAKR